MPMVVGKNGDTIEFRTGGLRRYRKGDVEIDESSDDDGEILVVSVKLRSSSRQRQYAAPPAPVEPSPAVQPFCHQGCARRTGRTRAAVKGQPFCHQGPRPSRPNRLPPRWPRR